MAHPFRAAAILKLTTPAPQIRNWVCAVQFEISDFGFEEQESSNFNISRPHLISNSSISMRDVPIFLSPRVTPGSCQ